MRRLRILLLAETCNPEWPSLPIVAYKTAIAIADLANVTLVTHVRNKPAMDRFGTGQAKIVYIDNERIARPMHRLARFLRGGDEVAWTMSVGLLYLPYIAFERLAWTLFRQRLVEKEFDVVHRLTPMSPALPSILASRSPVPFVLGPLNGGLKWPQEFRAELHREREWMTYLRGIYRLLPYARTTYSRAAAVMASFAHTVADLPETAKSRVIDLSEVGIDTNIFFPNPKPRQGPITFVFVGRLVPLKCVDVAIEAFAGSTALRQCRLRIVGDGPERTSLVKIAAQHGAADRIEFLGRRTQSEVGQIMREAHVFVFPSIRELGAGVVVEAMACGLCSVVVDYGGPGGLVNSSRGVKVPLSGKRELVMSIRTEMERLAADPVRIDQLGAEASRHARSEYSWQAKAAKIHEVYRWVTGHRSDKPDFL